MALFQTLLNQAARDTKTIQAKDLKIQALTYELAHIRRLRYGVKSEALSPLQRDVFEETVNTDLAALEAQIEQLADAQINTTVTKVKRPRAGRQPLPGHLPRIEHRHEPESCTCGQCGSELVKIGEDITEQLDVEPAKFPSAALRTGFLHRHIRPQYACRSRVATTAAPIPPAVIDGGIPSGAQVAAVGFLAWAITAKYLDYLPLYRLEQIAARDKVILARATLAEWVGRIGVALQPLAGRLAWSLLQGNTLHADDDPQGCGKCRKCRSIFLPHRWRNSTPAKAKPKKLTCGHIAAMTSNRPRGRSSSITKPAEAAAMPGSSLGLGRATCWSTTNCPCICCIHAIHGAHDYVGYKALFSTEGKTTSCIELGCFAHARRKFFDDPQGCGKCGKCRSIFGC